MFSPHVPEWFKKELAVVDPTYRVEDTEDHDGYFIIKDLDLTLKADDGKSLIIHKDNYKLLRARGPVPIIWFPTFSTRVIEQLRQMKAKALEMGVFENPMNELAYYQKLKKEVKTKKLELAVDMVSEGLMEQHRLERKKSWSYGGAKKKPQEA